MEEMTSKQARRRKNHNNTTDSDEPGMIMNLPRDIIYEILSRLPIESVLRCMRVCKFWSTFRYDSYFIDLHFTKSMMHNRPPTVVLSSSSSLRFSSYKMSSQLMVSAEEGEGGDWRKATHIPIGDFELMKGSLVDIATHIPIGDFELTKGSVVDIVASCNGFLCIAPRIGLGIICLYNPITRESMKLPKSHVFLPPTNSRGIQNYFGFGFDSLSKKYKVILVYELISCEDHKKVIRYSEIITVGETSWRKLDFPTLPYDQLITDPVHLDGTLYWLLHIDDDNCSRYVLALDIDSEKFWTINCCPLPVRRESLRRRYLVQLDGCLAIIDDHSGPGSLALIDDYADTNPWSMDIWLLKGSKTMGFSFMLTTYDMSELAHWGKFFTVIGKHGHDTFLINIHNFGKKGFTMKSSVILYSPLKKQQYFCVQGGLYESDWILRSWMVPSLKSLRL